MFGLPHVLVPLAGSMAADPLMLNNHAAHLNGGDTQDAARQICRVDACKPIVNSTAALQSNALLAALKPDGTLEGCPTSAHGIC